MSTKKFRVLICDTTFYEAFLDATDEAQAIQLADEKYCDGGADGFSTLDRFDIVSEGTSFEVVEATEVQS